MARGAFVIDGDRTDRVYDVIVVGSTEAACAAAIKAARMGAKTLLACDTLYPGWMTGWGYAQQDFWAAKTSKVLWGISREYHAKVALNAGVPSIASYWGNGGAARPRWYQRAWSEILKEPNLTIIKRAHISAVSKTGAAITSITFDTGDDGSSGVYSAPAWVDGTATGDLLRLAGCSYQIGRESTATYSETSAGVLANDDMYHLASGGAVDPYITPGNAGSGLLFGIDSAAADATGAADGRVMQSCFRMVWTTAAGKLSFPEPSTYDATKYELLGRMMAVNAAFYTGIGKVFQLNSIDSNSYDVNSYGPFSSSYPDPVINKEYLTASYARRAEIETLWKDHVLGLIKWILTSNDVRIPSAVKTELATYGLSSLEWVDNAGFAPQAYIREPARLVNDNIFKLTDIAANNGAGSTVAHLYYARDHHYVRNLVVSGAARSEGYLVDPPTETQYAARVPMTVMIPRAAECTNLVVAYGAAYSHRAWAAARVVPTTMEVGESAGAVAAIAAREKLTVQNVIWPLLYEVIDPRRVRGGIWCSVNDGANTFGTTTSTGTWTEPSTSIGPSPDNQYSRTSAAGVSATKKVQPKIREAGEYDVYLDYPPADTVANGGQGRPTNAVVTIVSGGGTVTTTRTVNQVYNAAAYHDEGRTHLGRFWFAAGSPSADYVLYTSDAGTDGIAAIAGVYFEPVARK